MENKCLGLKKLREELDITQLELAKTIGMTRSNYCLKENGKVQFRQSEMLKILEVFNNLLRKKKQGLTTLEQIFLV